MLEKLETLNLLHFSRLKSLLIDKIVTISFSVGQLVVSTPTYLALYI